MTCRDCKKCAGCKIRPADGYGLVDNLACFEPSARQIVPPLKPCPFCGGEGEVYVAMDYTLNNEYCVMCKTCGASTGQPLETKAGAAALWNIRAEVTE